MYGNPIAPSFYSISPWNTLNIAIMFLIPVFMVITVAGIQIFSFFILFSDLKFLHIGQCIVNMFLQGKISLWTNYFTNKEGLLCYYNLFTYNLAWTKELPFRKKKFQNDEYWILVNYLIVKRRKDPGFKQNILFIKVNIENPYRSLRKPLIYQLEHFRTKIIKTDFFWFFLCFY